MSAERTLVEAADAVEGLARVLAPYYAEPLRALIEHARAAGVMSHHPYDTAGHLPGDMSLAEAADLLVHMADRYTGWNEHERKALFIGADRARAAAHPAEGGTADALARMRSLLDVPVSASPGEVAEAAAQEHIERRRLEGELARRPAGDLDGKAQDVRDVIDALSSGPSWAIVALWNVAKALDVHRCHAAAAPGQGREQELAAWLDEQIARAVRFVARRGDGELAPDERAQMHARADALREVRDRLRALARGGDQEGQS